MDHHNGILARAAKSCGETLRALARAIKREGPSLEADRQPHYFETHIIPADFEASVKADHDTLVSLLPPDADVRTCWRITSVDDGKTEVHAAVHRVQVRVPMPDGSRRKFGRILVVDETMFCDGCVGERRRHIHATAERFYRTAQEQSVGKVRYRELWSARRMAPQPFRVELGKPIDLTVYL